MVLVALVNLTKPPTMVVLAEMVLVLSTSQQTQYQYLELLAQMAVREVQETAPTVVAAAVVPGAQ